MASRQSSQGLRKKPRGPPQSVPSGNELLHLSAALQQHKDQRTSNAIRLLLLTGARRMEVLAATWDMFDLVQGTWVKPSAHTKQKKEHRVPLSAPARKLLLDMKEAAEAMAKKEKREATHHRFPATRMRPILPISRSHGVA